MPAKIDELQRIVEKFEDSLKMNRLQREKKFKDLEIRLEELNKEFKEIEQDFPGVKKKTEEIEDLIHVINLGIADYKKKVDELSSKVSKFEEAPDEIRNTLANHREDLEKLRQDIMEISGNLKRLDTLEKDLNEKIEETISTRLESLKENIERNRLEIEHVKKSLDGFSSSIKSFERTIELTNIDDIIRRFNALDKKITKAQSDIEGLRKVTPDITIIEGDIDALKTRVKEMSSTIMDSLSRMNEFELDVSKKMVSIEHLVEKAEDLGFIESAAENVEKHVNRLKEVEDEIGGMYEKISKKVTQLEDMDKKIKNLKKDVMEIMNKVDRNRSLLKNVDMEGIADLILTKKENREKIIEIMRRLDEMEKELEGEGKPRRISRKLWDEMESMKKIINRLSRENEELRKRLEEVPRERGKVPENVLGKIDKLENRIIQLEGRLEPKRRIESPKKRKRVKLPERMSEKLKRLEEKIKELEKEPRPVVWE